MSRSFYRDSDSKKERKPTVLNSRCGTIKLCRFMSHDEHWDLGPIFTLVPDLRHKVSRPQILKNSEVTALTCSETKSSGSSPLTKVVRYVHHLLSSSISLKSYRATTPGVVKLVIVTKISDLPRRPEIDAVPTKSGASRLRRSPVKEYK
jgi:hypothetical protein